MFCFSIMQVAVYQHTCMYVRMCGCTLNTAMVSRDYIEFNMEMMHWNLYPIIKLINLVNHSIIYILHSENI